MLFCAPMLLTLFAGIASLSSAHALEPNSIVDDHALYSRLYPTHVEYCAGTELAFIGGVKGGPGGHGFTYVHGLCKDMTKDYPQVKPCDGTEGHAGVGISVNSDFKNVNWVAVPTHSLVFNGDLRDKEKVTAANLERIADEAGNHRIFENVVLNKAELTRDANGRALAVGSPDYMRAMAKNSVGTDLGTRLARNLECVRLPIRESSLQKIADHLNALNDGYYLGKREYVWSGLKNNCAHVATEILAEAGIRDAIPKEGSNLKELFNLAMPRNGVYTLIQNGILRSVLPWDVYGRADDRKSIESKDPFMPTQVGVLAKRYAAFKDNSVFKISTRAVWVPQKEGNVALDRAMFKVPEYSEIGPNLLLWEKILLKQVNIVNAEWVPTLALKWKIQSLGVYGTKGYDAFEPHYARYVDAQLAAVQARLTALGIRGISN